MNAGILAMPAAVLAMLFGIDVSFIDMNRYECTRLVLTRVPSMSKNVAARMAPILRRHVADHGGRDVHHRDLRVGLGEILGALDRVVERRRGLPAEDLRDMVVL